MASSERGPLVVGSIAVLVLGLLVALRLEVTTDITHFLPGGEADPQVALARQLAASELSRTMVLLVDVEDRGAARESPAGANPSGGSADAAPTSEPADVVAVSRAMEAALRAEPRVAEAVELLEGGPPAGIEEALWRLYQPRRFAFLASDPAAAAAELTPPALRDAALRLKRRLALPISGLLSQVAPADPLLVLPRLLERIAGGRNEGLRVVDGRFTTADGGAAVLFLATRASASDTSVQGPLLAGVRAAFDAVNARYHGRLRLLQSGTNRFAVRTEAAIAADIQRVTIGSVAGLTALLLVLFRSLRLVLLALPVMASGFLAGTAACLLAFGEIHGLTLAFGAALIGVSIDYAVHFHCHHALDPHPLGPRRTLLGIWPGLLLSAATTIAGFVALIVSTFPGLRELALFGACGIAAALLATRLFLPGLAARARPEAQGQPAATATQACHRLAARLDSLLSPAPRRVWWMALPALLVVVAAALGVPAVRWSDAFADLGRLDPELLAEDQAVRDRVIRYEQRRLVIASGADPEAALQANDRVAEALQQAVAAGELGGFRSLAALLPSAARQRAVDAAVRAEPDLWPRLRDALAAAGFVPEAFEPTREALAAPPPPPLLPADLADSPLASLVRPFRVTLGDGVGFVSFLHGLRDAPALARRLASVAGAQLIDIEAVLNGAFLAYRERMTSLLLLGLLAVVALVAVRHRALRPTIAVCAPAVLAAAGTVGLLGLAGVELNVLSLVALLMVVSMGVDYGVFLVLAESGQATRSTLRATRLAVLVAAATTILSFALLAWSDQPALRSIGLSAGIGVALCLLLSLTICAPALHARAMHAPPKPGHESA